MLTGELPGGRFAPPSQKVEVDVRLDQVVLRTLEKEPRLRYQQASELRTEVESLSDPGWTPDQGGQRRGRQGSNGYEFRSKLTVWGIPLVHVARSGDTSGKRMAVDGASSPLVIRQSVLSRSVGLPSAASQSVP